MRGKVLSGLLLIAVGIAGLVLSGEGLAAPWAVPGVAPWSVSGAPQSGPSGWVPGWGRMWGSMPGWRQMGGGMGRHMGWWGQSAPSGAAPAALAGAPAIEVTGLDFRFQPAQLRIKAGQPVNIALANRGAIIHNITIPALQFQLVAQPGRRAVASLTAARLGAYEFYCSVPGHRAVMVGRLVVAP